MKTNLLSACIVILSSLGYMVSSLMAASAPQDKAVSVEGFRQISSRIYCSGEPSGSDVFDQIAGLGIKTVVSVDGKQPDHQAAAKAGLRYVHLPIGYDGVPIAVQAALKQLLETTQGSILIHCHHGKNRGPAAAVIAAMIEGGISKDHALGMMKMAGTGADYKGLWRDVQNYTTITSNAAPAALVPVAKVTPFVREMTRMDDAFEKLEAIKVEAWNGGLANELTVVLVEGFREALRNKEKQHAPSMITHLKESLQKAEQFSESLKDSDPKQTLVRLEMMKQDCRGCHKSHRD